MCTVLLLTGGSRGWCWTARVQPSFSPEDDTVDQLGGRMRPPADRISQAAAPELVIRTGTLVSHPYRPKSIGVRNSVPASPGQTEGDQ